MEKMPVGEWRSIPKLLPSVGVGIKEVLLEFRAYRDGADEETVICALFHDVAEVMTPACHGEVGKLFLFLQLLLQIKILGQKGFNILLNWTSRISVIQ